jgi:protein-disulfide isomerase
LPGWFTNRPNGYGPAPSIAEWRSVPPLYAVAFEHLRDDPKEALLKGQHSTNDALVTDALSVRGPQQAAVTIVEFGDFECPSCKRLAEWIAALPESTKGQIKLVFRQFPLDRHPWTMSAAELAVCAGIQNSRGFWEVHDYVLAEQEHLAATNLFDNVYAAARKMPEVDISKLQACQGSHAADEYIQKDQVLAREFNVRGTPTICERKAAGSSIFRGSS